MKASRVSWRASLGARLRLLESPWPRVLSPGCRVGQRCIRVVFTGTLRQSAASSITFPNMTFLSELERVGRLVEGRLAELLAGDGTRSAGEATLAEAMRYAALGGGKRLRPFLLISSAGLFGVSEDDALSAACALECIHCYSLVHDDLPAMDDDALRRGRPTVHRAFDEATAILVGDGLLTFAFDLLSRPETHPDADVRIALVRELARAAGLGGMVGGQMLDLAAEGRFADGIPIALGEG